MINLTLRSEYSFKKTFGKITDITKHSNGKDYLGIAELNNTFSHVKFEKICKSEGIKPIFGVRLEVVYDSKLKTRSHYGPEHIFIAKNQAGLKAIYELVKSSYDNFYYKPMVPKSHMDSLNRSDVVIICENPYDLESIDYIGLSPSTNKIMLEFDKPFVALNNNAYSRPWDKEPYELLAGARKHGDGFRYLFNDQTYPRHILSEKEWLRLWPNRQDAIDNTYKIAEQCDVEIPSAPMVKYHSEFDIEALCVDGAKELGIDLKGEYRERLDRELAVILEKDFTDYFMVVAEMIWKAKKKMLVGPARGSSAGSLVCYLLKITTVDPIKHDLLFERFIDINRPDLPDIDIDFPDEKRQAVIKDLFKTYGKDNVYHIANINKLKAKSALDEFGMSLSIPRYKIDIVKDSIVDRSGGDARSSVAVADTLDQTDAGKKMAEEYPKINLVKQAEWHATHASKHAAGIIVCNNELTNYCGVNTRDSVIMMDKKEAEAKNLLKIDALGLRTLSILEDAALLSNNKIDFYYNIPLDDEKTFKIFKDMRLNGIFQFEGQAMQMLCKQMHVDNFDDVVALTALARPGPLHSGSAAKFIKRRNGDEEIDYICRNEDFLRITGETQGTIVYQEQLMMCARIIGQMSWIDVGEIRRSASKTLGKEHFDKYKERFIPGAIKSGLSETEAQELWDSMVTFGSWGMNKSHSVSYGYISYWCAYMKAHFPLEFTVAALNHTRDPSSAIKILRDATVVDGLEYVAVDPDESDVKWTVQDGKMVGGLTNIKGIAEKKAQEIIYKRENNIRFTPSIMEKLLNPVTPYDILYPTKHFYGDLFKAPHKYGLGTPPTFISEIETEEDGEFTIVGKVVKKDLRDLNEYNELVKRGGKVLDSDNLFLRLIVEDDTDQIMCKIERFDFDRMNGQMYSETLIEDESWVIIKGKVSKGWRIMKISAIFDLKNLEIDSNEKS
jgi:DNA polymerase III alpha subunit